MKKIEWFYDLVFCIAVENKNDEWVHEMLQTKCGVVVSGTGDGFSSLITGRNSHVAKEALKIFKSSFFTVSEKEDIRFQRKGDCCWEVNVAPDAVLKALRNEGFDKK